MLSENRGTGESIRQYGADYPFLKVKDYFQQADIIFGNLENPVSDNGMPCKYQDPHMTFRANPLTVKGLRSSGFNVLSLANNHAHDYGDTAFYDTLEILKRNRIKYVGAGKNACEAESAAIITRNEIRVGFLAYSCFLNPATKLAGKKRPGIAYFNLNAAKKWVKKIASSADLVVVSMHWGLDFEKYPVPFQMDYARELIDSGADLIIGHHPHCLQGIELYKHGIIAYSLGDFIFDEPHQETCILKCEVSKQGINNFDLIPAKINETLQAEIVKSEDAKQINDKIQGLSTEYKSINSNIADAVINRYIYINLYVFSLSWNLNVLRNISSPFLILRTIYLLLRKGTRLIIHQISIKFRNKHI